MNTDTLMHNVSSVAAFALQCNNSLKILKYLLSSPLQRRLAKHGSISGFAICTDKRKLGATCSSEKPNVRETSTEYTILLKVNNHVNVTVQQRS